MAKFDLVENFVNGRFAPTLDDVCRYLRKSGISELVPLANAVLGQSPIFHSFAHAGMQQIMRRLKGFEQREIVTALIISDVFSSMSLELASRLYKNEDIHAVTAKYAQGILLESNQLNGTTPPPGDWDGRLPELPDWPDLRG